MRRSQTPGPLVVAVNFIFVGPRVLEILLLAFRVLAANPSHENHNSPNHRLKWHGDIFVTGHNNVNLSETLQAYKRLDECCILDDALW